MAEFCQLAGKKPIDKVRMPAIGQLKYNGVRCLAFCDDGRVTFRTRNNKAFDFPKLEKLLGGLVGQWVLDGELCVGDSRNKDHTSVSGIVNSAIHGNPIADAHGINYHLFDMIPLYDWHAQRGVEEYAIRLARLEAHFMDTGPFVVVTKTWHFESAAEVLTTYDDLLSQGYEGLILKHFDDKYEWKRSKTWVKMKAEETADLLCTGTYEGTGKYTGMIGGLTLTGTVEGKSINVRAGSGMTDADRSCDPSRYVGKTIEIKYNEVIQDKATGDWSLFLPIYKGVRIDK